MANLYYFWVVVLAVLAIAIVWSAGTTSVFTTVGPSVEVAPGTFHRSTNSLVVYSGLGFQPNSPITISLSTSTVPSENLATQPVTCEKGCWELTVNYPGDAVTDYFIATALTGSTVNVSCTDGKYTATTSFIVVD